MLNNNVAHIITTYAIRLILLIPNDIKTVGNIKRGPNTYIILLSATKYPNKPLKNIPGYA